VVKGSEVGLPTLVTASAYISFDYLFLATVQLTYLVLSNPAGVSGRHVIGCGLLSFSHEPVPLHRSHILPDDRNGVLSCAVKGA